ncbi:unnamed protein product [Brugia pahangi]|uniref:Uncharacterized protein n=1 Tax=Brugia pahangi TaxID=6280 RepID=A0A0N4T1J3_BRUPA|nr:unnamed protein product [Brugia pahangi]
MATTCHLAQVVSDEAQPAFTKPPSQQRRKKSKRDLILRFLSQLSSTSIRDRFSLQWYVNKDAKWERKRAEKGATPRISRTPFTAENGRLRANKANYIQANQE